MKNKTKRKTKHENRRRKKKQKFLDNGVNRKDHGKLQKTRLETSKTFLKKVSKTGNNPSSWIGPLKKT
jgi:hypothetical protein